MRSRILTTVLFTIFLCFGKNAIAQLQISTPDTVVCPNTSVTLNTLSLGTPPTNPTFSAQDDAYSTAVPIGFTFNFFGNNYSQCLISLNGYIKFDLGQAGNFSPWNITQAIPGNPNVLNSVMGFYSDIIPLLGTNPGTIDYQTIGTAPNRKFVVSFCDCPMFSCTNMVASFQIMLYETTNEIEVHIANAPNCPTWNAGAAIEGIQNATGTIAYPVPGRNYPTQWSAFQSSHRWTPTGPNTYTVTAIPYAPVPGVNAPVTWYANGITPVGNGPSVTVTPVTNTFYVAEAVKCQDTMRDTVYVTIGGGPIITNISPDPNDTAIGHPTTCGGNDGFIKIFGMMPDSVYELRYRKDGVQVTPISIQANSQGSFNIGGLGAGTYDSIMVFDGPCFGNAVGPIVLVDPPAVADFEVDLHLGCTEDTIFLTNNSIQNTYNLWHFGDGNIDTSLNPVYIYTIQGIYDLKLVVSNGFCSDSLTIPVNTLHPLNADFSVDDDSSCTGQMLTFTNASVGIDPVYFWDFGDSTTSTLTNPTHTYTVPGVYEVMLIVTDTIPCSDTAWMTVKVDSIPYANFVTSDSALCEGQQVTLIADYLRDANTGINWDFGDGYGMPDEPHVSHVYDTAGIYTVTFTATYANCPDEVVTRDITITPFPTLNLGADTTLCPNGEALLIGDLVNQFTSARWLWNTGDTTAFIAVRHPGIYTASVSRNGCSTADSVEIFKDCYLNIPNSFTPNGDGQNDYFLPRQLLSSGVTGFKMTIFNRWGQVIFETVRTDGRGWDGRFNGEAQPTGVYIYQIEATFKNGVREQYTGNVTLLR